MTTCPDDGATLVDGACPNCEYAVPDDTETKAAGGGSVRHAVMPMAVDLEELERRRAQFLSTRAEGDLAPPSDELLPISISSEHPVERYDWWEGERYSEVLSHSDGAVDLSRAIDGMPFLDSHNARDGNAQMGRVMNVRVSGSRLLGDVKFSRRQAAQDMKRDMLDGIKREISVGYIPDYNNLERTQSEGEPYPTVLIKRWTPFEASCVAVPADPTVGVGRAEDRRKAPRRDSLLHIAKGDSTTQPDSGTRGTVKTDGAPANSDVRVGDSADNQAAMREISVLADKHGMQDKLPGWIRDGVSPQDARGQIIATLEQRLKDGPKFAPKVDLTEKEEREYSFARAIADAAEGRDSFEMEVSRAIEAKLGGNAGRGEGKGNRVYVPTHLRHFPEGYGKRTGLDSGTSTKGTELKFTVPGTFIEMLRNKARVLQLGATMLSGLEGNVSFPKQTAPGTFSWMGENPGSPVSLSDLTLGAITMSPKTGMSATKFSKQLLRQSSFDVESMVRNDIALIHALGIDAAAINGLGTSNQPQGILANTSVGVVALGANGVLPDYASLVKLETAVEKANGDTGARGYLTTPGVKGTLKTTQKFATTNGESVWVGGEAGEVNGYPAYESNQVPANLTKGTATTVCSAIIYGSWANLTIGEWGSLEILVDPYTLAGSGMYAVTSFQMLDVMLRYPESFGVIKDALVAAGF